MERKLAIEYGNRTLPLRIPDQNVAFDIAPREGAAAPPAEAEVGRALAAPINSSPLAELVRPGQTVALIVDDHTRLTPSYQILPLLLDELNRGGIPDAQVTMIIASGTHRAMTPEEKEAKFGADVLARVRTLDHAYLDRANLRDLGTTARGTHLWVNAEALEADVRIAVGIIFPHFPAGWGGGAKMLLPGIAGEETVAEFHMLGNIHPETRVGQIDTVTRQEMEEFAARVGLHFILNVVLDKEGRILRAFAGHFVQAHRAGVEFARTIYEVEVPEAADLLLSSPSPIDHDYFQVMKGLYSAEVCTRAGGEIMLISPIYEGMAATHREALEITHLGMEEAMRRIQRGEYTDSVGAAIAAYQIKLRQFFQLSILSEHLSAAEADQLGVRLYTRPEALQALVDERLAQTPALKVGVLHQSTEVLPRVRQGEHTALSHSAT
ncbi:MAG: nickel-dependent lactate racemase [Ardenticatenaceae bacterium]|nr:nickel-dependent lactate racemase [Ardenticatenaceae bacterium]